MVRAAADVADPQRNEIAEIRECISNGELVPFDIVMKYVDDQMERNIEAKGIILDGFPRNIDQAYEFEAKVSEKRTQNAICSRTAKTIFLT